MVWTETWVVAVELLVTKTLGLQPNQQLGQHQQQQQARKQEAEEEVEDGLGMRWVMEGGPCWVGELPQQSQQSRWLQSQFASTPF